jgi:hypothetical protein
MSNEYTMIADDFYDSFRPQTVNVKLIISATATCIVSLWLLSSRKYLYAT